MKKIISMMLVLVMTMLVLASCNPSPSVDESTDNEAKGDEVNKEPAVTDETESRPSFHYAVKTLFSYDDVMSALEIVKQRHDVRPTYTVKDMGDDYTVFYEFFDGPRLMEYPIDYDTYFTTMSMGVFNTFIFLNNRSCPDADDHKFHPSTVITAYKEDENYDKLIQYIKENVCVWMTQKRGEVVEISDESLLTYEYIYTDIDGDTNRKTVYYISYDDQKIMELWSCVELDDKFFEDFFNGLVTIRIEQ